VPPLLEVEADHAVACHFVAEVDGSVEQRQLSNGVAMQTARASSPATGSSVAARAASSSPAATIRKAL